MSDIIDQAEHQEQMARAIAIKKAQSAVLDTSNPSGKCWQCGEKVDNRRRWCGVECRDMYEKVLNAKLNFKRG